MRFFVIVWLIKEYRLYSVMVGVRVLINKGCNSVVGIRV